MTSTQLAQLEDEELLERVRVAPSATCAELANRFEAQQALLEAYQAIGPVEAIMGALELARKGSLHLETYASSECTTVNNALAAEIDAALGKLKF